MTINLLDVNGQYVKGYPKVMLQNKDVISNEILNVLTTTAKSTISNGERPFEPTFGGGLWYKLFEPMDEITASDIGFTCFVAIANWVPHIEVLMNDIDVIPNYDKSYYEITVYWRELTTDVKGVTKLKAYHAGTLSPVM